MFSKEEQKKYKSRYDKRRFQGVTYDVGEIVFAKCAKPSTGESNKLKARYNGPYVIMEQLPSEIYRVRYLNRDYSTTYHVSQLKPYNRNIEEEDESEEDLERETIEEPELVNVPEDQLVSDSVESEKAENSEVDIRLKRKKRLPVKLKDYVVEK
ncbi:hypothetical protein NQ314_007621 [Rhamnusium bicolor]|uniref:Tf2-1-like SH3-like domain-containing protein n=1 Tax=Rhamnusium bicolor TaxID=1586634 RepID=A0AAV8YMR6_9CUCU|nr:hypothetical protein NQ314_007621 [Rhamnusium bicolor]